MPSNTGRLSAKLEGLSTTKKPSPLIAMKVPIEAFWMSPCTVLVEREFAATLPASCLVGMLSGIRSTKLVSSRLNAVVCELAMLPDVFEREGLRAHASDGGGEPKIPMTRLH